MPALKKEPHAFDANLRCYTLRPDGAVDIEDGERTHQLPPPPSLPPLAAPPVCGANHCLAVHRSRGEAISWATSSSGNRFGQLGWGKSAKAPPLYEARPVETPAGCGRVVKVAAGDFHSALVDEAGSLYAWGCDRWTQLGQELLWVKGAVWQCKPQLVASLQKASVRIVDVACGADHTVALDERRQVWAWGRGEHGQLFGDARRPFTAPPSVSHVLQSGGCAARVTATGHCSCSYSEAGLLRCIGIGHRERT